MRKVFLDNLPKKKYGTEYRINWKESVGSKIKFIYDDIEDEMEVDLYKYPHLVVNYQDDTFYIRALDESISSAIIGELSRRYKYNIYDIVETNTGDIVILDKIKIPNGVNQLQKGYTYQCLHCNNIDNISEANLKNKHGCNVCCIPSKKILKGYNDLWTTHPHIAKLLKNKNEGYEITAGNNSKFDFICPDCGEECNDKFIVSVVKQGVSCKKCSDQISYPEKFMFDILKQLNLDFECQNKFEWSKNKKYDFYIPTINCIIETHGLQHYKEVEWTKNKAKRKKTLKEEQENDKLKEKLAKENGIDHYVVIDCRKSELEWIKNSVLGSELSELFDLTNVDWLKCHEFACSSLVKKACDLWNNGIESSRQIATLLKLSVVTIVKYLKQGSKCNLCDYNPKEQKSKKIICLNTKEIFKSIRYASEKYEIPYSRIYNCCNDINNITCTKIANGQLLQWQYYDEYRIKPKRVKGYNQSFKKIIQNNTKQKIICLNTKETFEHICDAMKKYNIKGSHVIGKCCKGEYQSAGKHPETGERLKWMYYEDYIKLHNENKAI